MSGVEDRKDKAVYMQVKTSSSTGAAQMNASGVKIGFELLAPYNPDVKLMGNWNDWQPIPMERGDDGTWRAEVALSDGDYEYRFQVVSQSYFMLGQTVSVADPKAISYTLDSHENSRLRVKNGQRVVHEYTWQHDDKPLPGNDQLVIYEMHVADFRGGAGDNDGKPGTFNTAIEKLDYLADLGITAIELMPINEFPGEHSWGYAARGIYAVENSYGSPEDLCRLIDECHARGIRVLLDCVYNHMESEAHLTKIDYNYWFYQENPDEPSLQFGPKFNYEKFDENLNTFPAREHVIGAMDFWVQNFHIDGIRFDCTRAIRYFDLLTWFDQEMHSRVNFKPFYTIAEHIPQDPSIAGPNRPMDAAWYENLSEQLLSTVIGQDRNGYQPYNTTNVLRLMDGRQDGFENTWSTVTYLDNHDKERVMLQLGNAAIFDEAAFRRAKLGASLLLTAPGLPLIWMGQEFGQASPKVLEKTPIDWALLNNPNNVGLFEHYKHLIRLRTSLPALTSDTYEAVLDLPDRNILAFKRWNNEGSIVLVVANLCDEFAGEWEIADAALEDGTWRELIYNYEVQVSGGRITDKLAESEVKVYMRQ